jgi:hypothetical protein
MHGFLTDKEMPALFHATDRASLDTQATYISTMRNSLLLIVASSIIGVFSFDDVRLKMWSAAISALFLAVSMILTLLIQSKKWEDVWYEGRAVAESIKTLSWKYSTCAEPFVQGIQNDVLDKNFVEDLKGLMKNKQQLADYITGTLTQGKNITDSMRNMRNQSFGARLAYYIEHRIENQRLWYANKSVYNKNRESTWFTIIILAQLIALASAIYIVVKPTAFFNPTGLLSGVASAGIAWLQLKRHQELTRSYNIASLELGMIVEQSRYVDSENKLAVFIADSETAISREHTLWLARRDKFTD